jgi:hypothetical protein
MKALITTTGQIGPFNSIETLSDRFLCDGTEYQFSVIPDTVIGEYVKPPVVITDKDKTDFIVQIDAESDALIRAVIGERASQYEGAEREALAYKTAGYTGTVPPKVQAWATAKNQTPTWAADSQIATAAGWRVAENALYATRLLLKEVSQNATDINTLHGAKSQWFTFMAALKTSLGVK